MSDQRPADVSRQTLVAWAAGIFEGEGSIVSHDHRPALQVKMTDLDVLQRLHAIFGGKLYGPYQDRTPMVGGQLRKPFWMWSIRGWDAVARVAAELRPWLGARRGARLDQFLVPALPFEDDEP